jgi:hypothetical protein
MAFRARIIRKIVTGEPAPDLYRALRTYGHEDERLLPMGLREAMKIHENACLGLQPVIWLPDGDLGNNPLTLSFEIVPA